MRVSLAFQLAYALLSMPRRREDFVNRSPMWPCSGAGRQSDQFPITEMGQGLDRVFATVATVFGSAERQAQEPSEVVVNQNHADVDSPCDAKSTLGVSSVEAGEKAVLG